MREMRVLLPDGRQYGGADAALALAEDIWWGRPVVWLAKVPGMKKFLRRAYRWIAGRRRCSAERCEMKGNDVNT
jgi:hypothetical protein